MWHVIVCCVGFVIGFAIAAIMSTSGREDQLQEAYNRGYMDGKRSHRN